MFDTYIGTASGVFRLRDGALDALGLDGERISAIHAWRAGEGVTILAGSYEHGLYRSTDDGQNWTQVEAGLTAPCFRCIGPDPWQPGAILAGTEPGRTFRSADGGATWEGIGNVTAIPDYDRWYLPYSPRAGAVRNIYGVPGRPGHLFASVEVGGLLRSEDGGANWRCEPVGHDDDIHYVTGHPANPDLLYAALGYASLAYQGRDERPRMGGVARSRDGGRTWEKLERHYTRAIIVPPSRPDLILAAPAPHVGREGRIVVSADGGDSWTPAGDGIATPMPDMVERFVAAPDDTIWAICSGGRTLRAAPGEWSWHAPLPGGTELKAESVSFVGRA
jgi:photosystem II stability/assembly factor-like uncharacterized protein